LQILANKKNKYELVNYNTISQLLVKLRKVRIRDVLDLEQKQVSKLTTKLQMLVKRSYLK
jgi:hypothetical protein